MKRRARLHSLAVVLTVMMVTGIIIVGVLWVNGGSMPSERIELPNVEMVTKIEIEQFGSGSGTGIAVTENHSDVETIMSALSNAKRVGLTRFNTQNEFPPVSSYLTIQIHGVDNEQQKTWIRLSLYTNGNREYVYREYIGMYKIDPKLSAEIYQIYNILSTTVTD